MDSMADSGGKWFANIVLFAVFFRYLFMCWGHSRLVASSIETIWQTKFRLQPALTHRTVNGSKPNLGLLETSGWIASSVWVIEAETHWIYKITFKLPFELFLRANTQLYDQTIDVKEHVRHFDVFITAVSCQILSKALACPTWMCCSVSYLVWLQVLRNSGLVASLALKPAWLKLDGSDNLKRTWCEIMATPLFKNILGIWILHR